ncbi:hypothetical protein [Natrinema altunense]|uniref:Uncharacterized protein n=1 Tax=Natrinema altunense TaxID=222984 RepID=A0A482XXH7_9EURY|nr:hypothetical protein [Natrinema altunense]RZH67180.1 hypothetical protein ELS17_15650 [Natrinema altunense]
MTERIEFGSKAAADQFRDEHTDHLSSDDDRRLKTVAISSDAPDHVLEAVTIEAAAGRSERGGRGGQAELTDHERESLDFSRTTVPHARSVKGLMIDEGVDDWLAYYDHTLSVDEHREVAQRATRDERGDRLDGETNVDDRLADLEGAQDEQCGHARDHCEDGEDEACEFLVESCGFDEEDVEALVGEARADDPPGELYGAKNLAWRRYQIAVAEAKEAAAAINELNDLLGEPTTAFRELGQRELTKDDIDW